MSNMQVGNVVEHKDKESKSGYPHNGTYLIIDFCRMKNSISREWEDAVIYENPNGKRYVRELNDFIDKFQKVEINESKG